MWRGFRGSDFCCNALKSFYVAVQKKKIDRIRLVPQRDPVGRKSIPARRRLERSLRVALTSDQLERLQTAADIRGVSINALIRAISLKLADLVIEKEASGNSPVGLPRGELSRVARAGAADEPDSEHGEPQDGFRIGA